MKTDMKYKRENDLNEVNTIEDRKLIEINPVI